MSFEFRARQAVTACLLLLVLAACSARPFVVPPPEALAPKLAEEQAAAKKAGHPSPRLLSLCHSRANSPEALLAEARYECAEGDVTYLSSDWFWSPCGLLQPIRASYLCQPTPTSAE